MTRAEFIAMVAAMVFGCGGEVEDTRIRYGCGIRYSEGYRYGS